jgi:CubicO group peptidase (beta-lactamase class C family)
MKARKVALGLVGALVVAGAAGWFSLDKETRGLLATLPTNRDVLFWSQPQRDAAFRALDRLPVLAKARVVPAGSTPMPLPPGPPLKLPLDVDAYMAGQRSASLLIVHDGKLRLERYGLGFDNSGRWTTFSVAKSMTSTLVGAAIKDGYIRSMDDKVSDYIPEMKGSAYDDVSIRQLLTMTSGVKWNEDYADPNSDVAQFNNHKPEEGVDALVSYLRRLPREAPAGTRWLYSTGETNLVGVLLGRATKKPLATYLSEKIWVPGRDGAAGDLDPQPQRQGDQWLLHPGRAAGLRPLRRLHRQRRPRRRQEHRARGLAGRGDERAHRHPPAGARLRLPVVDLHRRHLRRARHLRPGHLHRPEAQGRHRLQRQLGGRRDRPGRQRGARGVLPDGAEGRRRRGRRDGELAGQALRGAVGPGVGALAVRTPAVAAGGPVLRGLRP